MTSRDWTDIAKAIAAVRDKVLASWPPRHGYMADDPSHQHRRLIRAAKLEAIDAIAKAVCRVLKSRSSRFDPQRFVALVGVGRE